MDRLSTIANKQTITSYAQGVSQNIVQSTLGNFISPTVNVTSMTGYYKKYDAKNQYKVPVTSRNIGERATRIGWSASDETYNCKPHALDCAVDYVESMADAGVENLLKDAADLVAESAALAHEVSVFDQILSLTAQSTSFASSVDVIELLDDKILSLMKSTGLGASLKIRAVFGASAWKIFKNHASVAAKISGLTQKTVMPSIGDLGSLVLGSPEARISYALTDTSATGKAKSLDFIFDNKILLFVGSDNPTRRDPSFMKTFRLANEWMKPGVYQSEDGRSDIAKMDWSEDVQMTNSSAALLLNITTS